MNTACLKCKVEPAVEGMKWGLNCQAKARDSYQRNKETHKKSTLRRRQITRQAVIDYLLANPCADCGESDPVVLEFDHVDGKEENVSTLVGNGHSLERIFQEIARCEVVCANCHKRRTAEREGWFKLLV